MSARKIRWNILPTPTYYTFQTVTICAISKCGGFKVDDEFTLDEAIEFANNILNAVDIVKRDQKGKK